MATPENHFNAFFELAERSKTEEMEQFTCFPLRTTFIPCYMTLDSKIVYHFILKSNAIPKEGSKFEIWGKAVNIKKRHLNTKGFRRQYDSMELWKRTVLGCQS